MIKDAKTFKGQQILYEANFKFSQLLIKRSVKRFFLLLQVVLLNRCAIIMISTLWSHGDRCFKDFL